MHTFLAFFLKSFCIRCVIGVFVAEKLVRHFSGEEYLHISVLMDIPAQEVHPDACPDGGYIIGGKRFYDFGQDSDHLILCHRDVYVFTAKIFCRSLCIFRVYRILVHSY